MKTLSKFFLFLSLMVLVSCSESDTASPDTDVPQAVLKQFETDHPNASDIQWMKHAHYFIVEFQEGNKEVEISYDPSGVAISTESEIDFEGLPTLAINYINETLPGHNIFEVSKNEGPEGVSYEVELDFANKEFELHFDEGGDKIDESIGELDEDEDDDDDDDDEND